MFGLVDLGQRIKRRQRYLKGNWRGKNLVRRHRFVRIEYLDQVLRQRNRSTLQEVGVVEEELREMERLYICISTREGMR